MLFSNAFPPSDAHNEPSLFLPFQEVFLDERVSYFQPDPLVSGSFLSETSSVGKVENSRLS